ncbi:uncharacterized protein N7459_005683 [Penicillium hispanicum]|uniref:uncharacterized protein n=1 Tax=Penicillium hispanicum TaxID=1080232 RepID=UPI0025422632|nr:uncharacterized protein N7459_005683 [Penicillium hispanicum]KAJ5579698.1 hypothetical protein N7459_005683 [Penicillium hispanicum]
MPSPIWSAGSGSCKKEGEKETTQLACYSHKNDGRQIPLDSALAAGCIGIEIGVHPSGGELLVGTTPDTLSRGRNLQTLYLDRLLQILRQKSTKLRSIASDRDIGAEDHLGAFANDPSRTLVLSVDFKADLDQLWDLLVAQLGPLREAGLLICANGSSVIQAPVTVVATRKAPFRRILESSTPLLALTSSPPLHQSQSFAYNNQNSYSASADFDNAIGFLSFNKFSEHQLSRLRLQVQQSHSRGLKIRYRGTPRWPDGPRNQIWRTLDREGVDVITVKEFGSVVQRNSRKQRGWWWY